MYTKLQYFGDREQEIRNRIHHPFEIKAEYMGRSKIRMMESEGRGPYPRPDPDHPVDAVILESDPVAYYPLDWGTVGNDYSGNEFHGSVHGTFNRIVRQVGTREMRMSSADPGAGISLPVPNMSKAPWSIEFLTDGTDLSNRIVIERGFGFDANSNFSIQTLAQATMGAGIQANIGDPKGGLTLKVGMEKPMHVAIVVDASLKCTIYANGVKKAEQITKQQPSQEDWQLSLFGRRASPTSTEFTFNLQGALSTVALYNRALSEEEIVNHHRVIFGGDFRAAK